MFIELVDALRCPRPHEESWLVLSATRLEARHVREGTLGCPVCHAEYPIEGGVADFRVKERATLAPSEAMPELPEAEELAAMLGLTDPLGFVVLVGAWARRADALLDLLDAPPLLLVDPPADVPIGPGLSGLRADAALPVAVGAARGVAVDDAEAARVESAARTTRAGGRLVAPVHAALPAGVRELARDARVWVAEREATPSAPITLHVRRG
ncbi:MAG TPA: hypothetical protein VL328_12535 [Gemmatimonadaceae bacterium]|jgi:uncharacterized protein YbaR (Trm112 family)|nr:hypothetical protein [Gemmatimonadaceae bacterium]